MLTMHCLTDDVEKHLLPQGVERGSFQIKFLSNSKRSAEINLHTGCKSSQTVLIKTAHRQRCKSVFVSSMISKEGFNLMTVKKKNKNEFLHNFKHRTYFCFLGNDNSK